MLTSNSDSSLKKMSPSSEEPSADTPAHRPTSTNTPVASLFKQHRNSYVYHGAVPEAVENALQLPPKGITASRQPNQKKGAHPMARSIDPREVAISITDRDFVHPQPQCEHEHRSLPSRRLSQQLQPQTSAVLATSFSKPRTEQTLNMAQIGLLDLGDDEFRKIGKEKATLKEAQMRGYFFTNVLEGRLVEGAEYTVAPIHLNKEPENGTIRKWFVVETAAGRKYFMQTLRVSAESLKYRCGFLHEQTLSNYLHAKVPAGFPEIFAQASVSSGRYSSHEMLAEYRGESILMILEKEVAEGRNVGLDCLDWAGRSAAHLAAMHKARVFHRNIALGTIVASPEGNVSIVGLGGGIQVKEDKQVSVKEHTTNNACETEDNMVVTAAYTSPELADRSSTGRSLEKADVYAWGVSMCKLLIKWKGNGKLRNAEPGKRLYEDQTEYRQVRKAVRSMKLNGITQLERDVLVSAVLSSVSWSPEHRHSFKKIAASFRNREPLDELDDSDIYAHGT